VNWIEVLQDYVQRC